MGSVEVYDYKKMQWVPYIPNIDKWVRYFEDISAGRVRPDYKGRYIVGSGSHNRAEPLRQEQKPTVKLVTPVTQAVEMARSELKREQDNSPNGDKYIRKKRTLAPPGKRVHKLRSKKPKFDTQFDD